MYHTHSDAVCFWAVILLYTLYLDVYYDSCYDVYICNLDVCLHWLFYDDTQLYIVHVYNHTARQQGVSSSLQTSNLFTMTKTHTVFHARTALASCGIPNEERRVYIHQKD